MLTRTPSGLDEIIHIFGSIDDPSFEATQIVSFELPYPLRYDGVTVRKSRCHRLLVHNFQAALREILDADLTTQLRTTAAFPRAV